MHRRRAIRDAVVAGLSAAPEILALVPVPAVEASRWIPMDSAALPRILVYMRGEKVDGTLTIAPLEYKVLAELVVEYVTGVKPTDGPPENALDAVAEALEVALDRLQTTNLDDLARQCSYIGTDVEVAERGDQATCSLVMRYEVELGRVVAPLFLDDFKTASVRHAVGDAFPDKPVDVVTLPTV